MLEIPLFAKEQPTSTVDQTSYSGNFQVDWSLGGTFGVVIVLIVNNVITR